jgi:hypothetical protein
MPIRTPIANGAFKSFTNCHDLVNFGRINFVLATHWTIFWHANRHDGRDAHPELAGLSRLKAGPRYGGGHARFHCEEYR